MRVASIILLCGALGGCSIPLTGATEAPVSAARPADQLVGKKLDTLIAQLGQPTRSQPMDNDLTSYVWQIDTPAEAPPPTGAGGLYGDGNNPGYVSEGYSPFCRVNAVASATSGLVTQASTEESNGTGTPNGLIRSGNVCQQRLKKLRG
jgi:hypothetical protein